MKTAIPAILALVLVSGASAPALAANDPKEIVAMEAAWAKAEVTRDGAALSRILAPDWHGRNEKGVYYDRTAMIHDNTVGSREKLTSMTNHDLHVRFLGPDHAIVQGMDDESGVKNGKKINEVYSWLDVYEKRGGHWVAIASQNTKVK